ncbi:uncharacterized protein LOC100824219 [Brachypodium distachyon]|nr:uncharacterized protein LOC100824219 [Brachypodium distachyon]XP_010228262.1 uncharacterized protein LOC100824219 [Brachypodium distachyon]|eukprot:XP_003557452.2 uncharacterized protein LOC100824219 [Brachypodium distachyon]
MNPSESPHLPPPPCRSYSTSSSSRSSSTSGRTGPNALSAPPASARNGAAAFCLRYRDFHRTPPMLGFLYSELPRGQHHSRVRFAPTTAFRPHSTPCRDWSVIDARHGRVLFYDARCHDLVVWDPTTDGRRRAPLLHYDIHFAVLCATAGCDHRSCRGGPFVVVLLGKHEGAVHMCARVYSSEGGAWSDAASVEHPDAAANFPAVRGVLVEKTFPGEPESWGTTWTTRLATKCDRQATWVQGAWCPHSAGGWHAGQAGTCHTATTPMVEDGRW